MIYLVISAEIVVALYVFGVGTRSQIKTARPATPTQRALYFVSPLQLKRVDTDHPLGPKLSSRMQLSEPPQPSSKPK